MKTQLLLLSALCLSIFTNANPWAHRYASVQSSEYFAVAVSTNFDVSVEWGEGGWDANGTRFGYGLSQDGSDWNWDNEVFWFQDGDGSNKRCKATIQLPRAGKFYYAFKMVKGSVSYYASGSESWAETSTTLSAVSYISCGKYSIADGDWSASGTWNSDAAASDKVGIYHNVTLDQNPTLVDLNVQNGAKLIIPSGFTFVNSGTINQNTTGLVDVKQAVTANRLWYWSSPVSNAKASVLQTDNNVAGYSENGSGSWTIISDAANTSLTVGRGYASKQYLADQTVNFSGTLNSGDVELTLTKAESGNYAGFHLLGNPYPSYLDIETLIKDNTNIQNTIWYRSYNGSQMVFDLVNLNDPNTYISNSGRTKVSGIIPPMQAFWVKALASTTLRFTNAMRGHAGENSTAFKAPEQQNTTNSYLKLQISNLQNTDETLVYFNPDAKNLLDDYDSQKLFNNQEVIPELYSILADQKLAINGYTEISPDLSVQLGVKTMIPGNYTITASKMDNFPENVEIYLYDHYLNQTILLAENQTYEFQSATQETLDRFSLYFKTPSNTTDLPNAKNSGLNIEDPEIFDITGKRIQSRKTNLPSGLYIINGNKKIQNTF